MATDVLIVLYGSIFTGCAIYIALTMKQILHILTEMLARK